MSGNGEPPQGVGAYMREKEKAKRLARLLRPVSSRSPAISRRRSATAASHRRSANRRGSRSKRKMAMLLKYVSLDTQISILEIAEDVPPAQQGLVLRAAERAAKAHIHISQRVANVAAEKAAKNEVKELKDEAARNK
jgi:hypothetical protein